MSTTQRGLTPQEKAKVLSLIKLQVEEQIEWLKINSKKEWTNRELEAYASGAQFGALRTMDFVTNVTE